MGAWDPEPDYFHHWVRDAAIAMRAVPDILAREPEDGGWWRQAFADYVRFSLAISEPDRRGPERNPLRDGTAPEYRRFLRPDAELRGLIGEGWLEEPRCAADGGPDLERWNRPQDDGPALRAAGCLQAVERCPDLWSAKMERLVRRDLAHIRRVAGRPSIGPWEEAPARRTTFTLIAEWDALDRGAAWMVAAGETGEADALGRAAEAVAGLTLAARDDEGPAWRESIEAAPGHYDAATVLAILHAGREAGPFAIDGEAMRGTLEALEAGFAELYPINRGRPVPAMGRWTGDVYFDGNPWFPVTLGCAELMYRIAALRGDAAAWKRAELWMALVEEVSPPGDALPEQFHRETGAPVSCPALTWSAAAFIGAAAAREAAAQALGTR
jgi:glucoamylase